MPFKKGQSGNPKGKPKGTKNQLTVEVKDMVRAALDRAGERTQKRKRTLKELEPGVAYLTDQAEQNPVAFMTLLGKTIPQKVDMDVLVASAELVDTLHERRNQLARLREVHVIEGEAEEIDT